MSNFISQESIDEVSGRTDIVSVISEYVPLSERGRDWWGRCPFHLEKTPSFSVVPDKGFYHCFGCGASGTAFKFIQEMEKVSFAESVRILAKKAGIQLKYTDSAERKEDDTEAKLKEEYKNLYGRVAGTFHYMLTETEAGKFALDYITGRGISMETIKKFNLGYSPADRLWLKQFLLKKNYSKEFLDKSGLFSEKYPDYAFFSDRLMFPIFNREGDVVAMGGRFLRGNPDKSPKYINSGDLIQFKKGRTLYAFNFAKKSIREKKKVIFCEGYMDCIAYHQCGIDWAVAPLGTSLTEEHIGLIKHFVNEVYLSFDSDEAGQKATKKAILMCRKQSLDVKIICLSGGKDPAEIMQKFGKEYLTNEINSAIFDSDFLLSRLLEVYPKDTPVGKTKASLDFFEYIDSLQSDIQKDACLDQLCQTYGIEKEAARRDFFNRNKGMRRFGNANTEQKKEAVPEKIKMTAELQAVMTAVANDSSLFQKIRDNISPEDLSDSNARKLFNAMEECRQSGCFSASNIVNRIDNEEFKKIISQSISSAEDKGKRKKRVQESIDSCVNYLKKNALKRKKQLVMSMISSLSGSSLPEDKEQLKKLAEQKMELDSQLEKIGN